MRAWFTSYIVQLNSDLNDRNAISDLFAAGNEGANGKRIVQCNANTLNTPYKAGLTGGASGTAYLNISSATYGTILYIASGSNRMFLACKAGGAWGDWIEVVTNADLAQPFLPLGADNNHWGGFDITISNNEYLRFQINSSGRIELARYTNNSLNGVKVISDAGWT